MLCSKKNKRREKTQSEIDKYDGKADKIKNKRKQTGENCGKRQTGGLAKGQR